MVEITNENFATEVEQSTKPVVIDVFATWCGPCQQVAPIFEEVASELGDTYKFAKLNIDDARDIAIKFNVSSVPTFVFIKNGEVVGSDGGYKNKEALTELIKTHLG